MKEGNGITFATKASFTLGAAMFGGAEIMRVSCDGSGFLSQHGILGMLLYVLACMLHAEWFKEK